MVEVANWKLKQPEKNCRYIPENVGKEFQNQIDGS